MDAKPLKNQHQFSTRWYAGDEEEDDWIGYLHRNLKHVEGEDTPFPGSSWSYDQTDAELHDEVLKKLYQSPGVDASKIKVTVVNRGVHLSGLVDSESARTRAFQVVKNIPDVWQVWNHLEIEINDKHGSH